MACLQPPTRGARAYWTASKPRRQGFSGDSGTWGQPLGLAQSATGFCPADPQTVGERDMHPRPTLDLLDAPDEGMADRDLPAAAGLQPFHDLELLDRTE